MTHLISYAHRPRCHRAAGRMDAACVSFLRVHPYLYALCMFAVLPVLTLLAVCALTLVATLPAAWLFGWL